MDENGIILNQSSRFVSLDEVRKSVIDVSLCYCGIQQCSPLHNNGPEIRDTCFVHIILKGKGILKMNGNVYHLSKNEAFFIPRGVSAQYTADAQDPWKYMWVGFSGLLALESLFKAGFSQRSPVRCVCALDNFQKNIENMVATYQSTYANELRRNGCFSLFLADLIDDYNAQEPKEKASDDQFCMHASQAYDHIMRNFSKPIKIEELANTVGVSRNYLFSCFKKAYQVSPKQFLNSVRMENACSLLITRNLHISEVARNVGFEDELAFSKAFKAYYHISPSRFRKQNSH
ncbi:AraC family transcriptional regulator [uncultured Sphaerochaeta sp.]|uniref:AraC family transcriptional regulator n=1 Tax=uncultured Sphaerochaeta sp. TaxID=886478 RepID=UPI002A0A6292|nr:AraC family transcriptional regulator [uncultured Sphaerochaeta sp.]